VDLTTIGIPTIRMDNNGRIMRVTSLITMHREHSRQILMDPMTSTTHLVIRVVSITQITSIRVSKIKACSIPTAQILDK
jgi:hypothetical protein